MSYITVEQANAWTDKFKLNLDVLDSELEDSVAVQVLAKLAAAYDVSGWADTLTTPALVRKIIAMYYVGWYFERTYSEDQEVNDYGLLLLEQAEKLIAGIIDGTLTLPEVPVEQQGALGRPLFYPTDASSAMEPSYEDSSLGGSKFSMGTLW